MGDSEHETPDAVNLCHSPKPDNRELAILDALALNTPYREISRLHRISIGALSKIARRQEQLETGAVASLMRLRTAEMLDKWQEAAETGAKAGKHSPARDWLLHAKAIDPLANEQQAGAKVAIIIGMPGSPADHASVQVIDTQGLTDTD